MGGTSPIGVILWVALTIFLGFMIFRLIMSYVFMFARSYEPRGVMLLACELSYTVTDPPVNLLRRVIPPIRLGNIGFDLSFLLLFILVILARSVASGL